MNSSQLLDHFDRLSEAPDAIPLLRRFILDLAVRGKLVEQDRTDEAPCELLRRIQTTKEASADRGPRARGAVLPVRDDEVPFPVSSEMVFARLAAIAKIEKGTTGIQSARPGQYPLVTLAEDRATCAEYQFDAAAAIVPLISSTGHGHASLKRMHYQVGKFALGNILCAITPRVPELISARFLYEYLWAYREPLLVAKMIGTANVSLTINKIGEAPIPIISPRSQSQLDKLMRLCDRLEAAQRQRESQRDRLARASLHRLNHAPDPTALRTHARFHLDHLPRLTTRSEHVRQLRQTLCNFAVRGKLVSQDPNDEPATELLKQIQTEKKRLAADGQFKGDTDVLPLDGDSPFKVPPGWVWAAFGAVVVSKDGERVPVSKELRNGRKKLFDYYGASGVIDKIDNYLFDKPLLLIGEDGANLINRSTPIAFIARGKYWVNNHAHVLDGISEGFLRYLELHINAIDLKPYVTGTAQPKMNQAKMNSIPIAVPPLAEQSRILARVDGLMALCDQLESQLTAIQSDSRRLLDALLHEALAAAT